MYEKETIAIGASEGTAEKGKTSNSGLYVKNESIKNFLEENGRTLEIPENIKQSEVNELFSKKHRKQCKIQRGHRENFEE